MAYEVLLFDADDTLYDYNKAESYALEMVFKELGVEFKKEYRELYKKINKKMWDDFEKGLISQSDLKVRRFHRLFEELNFNVDFGNYDPAGSYQDHLADSDFLFDESIDVLKDLSEKYRLAIITNGLKRVQEKRIRNHEIAKYFDEIIISDEINMRKPDREIFDYTLEKMNYKKKEKVLMVGDKLESDILGGINAGVDTCYINLHNKENNTEIKPTYEIGHIRDFLKVLK